MKKTHKVVMLPTEKASDIYLRTDKNILEVRKVPISGICKPQHLYIISDDEIKEGDNIYLAEVNTGSTLQKVGKIDICRNTKTNSPNVWKKIVATTDKFLCNGVEFAGRFPNIPLPQIPESFIQAYIKAYNEGKPITEVDLEMKLHKWVGSSYPVGHRPTYQLKLRQDNTVIVHQSKMYSRDEVKKLCEKAFRAGREAQSNLNGNKCPSAWIEDNLK